MSAWTYRSSNGNADPKIVPPRPRIPSWKGLGADSEEKHEPVSDIDTVAVDSLKALDPEWPIREADVHPRSCYVANVPVSDIRAIVTAPSSFTASAPQGNLCSASPALRATLRSPSCAMRKRHSATSCGS